MGPRGSGRDVRSDRGAQRVCYLSDVDIVGTISRAGATLEVLPSFTERAHQWGGPSHWMENTRSEIRPWILDLCLDAHL